MRNGAPERTLSRFWYAALLGFAGLGLAGPLSATTTIPCDEPPLIATLPKEGAQLGWAIAVEESQNQNGSPPAPTRTMRKAPYPCT